MHHLRRASFATTIAFAVLALVATPLAAQQDFSQVEITATDLGGGIHMLQGSGGNLGVSSG